MKKIFILAIISLMFISCWPVEQTHAETALDSNIEGEVLLKAENSPYIAGEDGINIYAGSRLIIEAGVTILFPEFTGLHVNGGELRIQGNNSSKVFLKGNQNVGWQGIHIEQGEMNADSLEIENSKTPIRNDDGQAVIHDLSIDGMRNVLRNDQYGIRSIEGETAISSSTIINFTAAGFYQESGSSTISGSQIKNNGIGILYKTYFPPVLANKNSLLENIGKVLTKFTRFILPGKTYADSAVFPLIASQNIISGNDINAQNLSEDEVIDMRNNFWGSETGPADSLSENILADPWLLAPSAPVVSNTCCSSILFIPGFEGTRLNKGQNQLWEPNRNTDVEKLYLNANGQSLDSSILVGEIIKKTNIGLGLFDQSIYDSFASFLDRLVINKTLSAWRSFPYDWRADLPISSIVEVIQNLATNSLTGKVTLIGHSNGGLIAKKVAEELKNRNLEKLIDKMVLVAVPQVGAASSISALLHGDDQGLAGGLILNKATAREFGNNMIGAYNLLPSSSYVSASPLISFASSTDQSSNLRSLYGNTINSFDSLKKFLLGLLDRRSPPAKTEIEKPAVLNPFALEKAEANHSWLDSWKSNDQFSLYQIGAIGLPTSNSLQYFSKTFCSQAAGPTCIPQYAFKHQNLKTTEGDGTVPIFSSLFMKAPAYLFNLGKYDSNTNNKFSHATILESSPIQQTVEKIITNGTSSNPSSYFSYNESGLTPAMLQNSSIVRRYAVHSPVTLNAYDREGRHTGVIRSPDGSSDITLVENNIPGSVYEEIGDDKYIYMAGAEPLRFEMRGIESGLFSFDIEENKNNQSAVTLAVFNDVPVSEGSISKTEIIGTSSIPADLKLDFDGNGTIDVTLKKNAELSTLDYLNIFVLNLKDLNLPPLLKQRLSKITDRLIALAKKGKDEKINKKLKNFYALLEAKKIKHKHLNSADLVNLQNLISNTLDILEKD